MKRFLAVLILVFLPWPVTAGSVSKLFQKVSTSVVVIKTSEREILEVGQQQPVSIGGIGSGVLISQDGMVLTAAHVVQTADVVVVEFATGEKLRARVVASEPSADVALLKLVVDPPDVHVAILGDSEEAEVGDEVFVIGAPLGISHTLTVGHISARRRPNTIQSGFRLGEFFQTDAAINQGNSGGPMFNMEGEVIGVVSYIITQSGGSDGLGFAVTSNTARDLLLGEPSFWSGLEGLPLSGDLAGIFNLPQPGGVLVQKVAANSPAESLGLRPGTYMATIDGESMLVGGDIILSVMGIKVGESNVEAIREAIRALASGDTLRVEVLRQGKRVSLATVKP
ncbi:MAG: trypsin-like peptidase domain-containing protein [Acidobacteria bacterium]|nr:trypsin-like peptidase domain-containing protein [Acidobacteriota bacterium]MCZ6746577.1 trypsin-like peptidase domain-containing protein [Acidobacteriota bacterium]MCZ6833969.1 trypsin-like peptidase domain-containing protein [Acidobacteriota bacterium]